MAVWDDIKSAVEQVLDFIRLQQMVRIGPYQITVTTDSQRVIPQGEEHLRKAYNIYITLTDLDTMTGTDKVLVGMKGREYEPLYGEGDEFYDESPPMRWSDATDLWIKTTANTAVVTVEGLAYPSDLMAGLK